jgi:SCF-associated factor 1
LTQSGSVLIEWPFEGALNDKIQDYHAERAQGPDGGEDTLKNGSTLLECPTWEIDHVLLELPSIPTDLPHLEKSTGAAYGGDSIVEELKIVKIAVGESFVVGVTNGGHVLKIDLKFEEDPEEVRDRLRRRLTQWVYVSSWNS